MQGSGKTGWVPFLTAWNQSIPEITLISVSEGPKHAPEQKRGPYGPALQLEVTLSWRDSVRAPPGDPITYLTPAHTYTYPYTEEHTCVSMYICTVNAHICAHTPLCRTKDLSTPTLTS